MKLANIEQIVTLDFIEETPDFYRYYEEESKHWLFGKKKQGWYEAPFSTYLGEDIFKHVSASRYIVKDNSLYEKPKVRIGLSNGYFDTIYGDNLTNLKTEILLRVKGIKTIKIYE